MSTSILPILQVQLTRYVTLVILVTGNIGNVFIVILFSKHRKNACSVYLLCAAVMNFVNISVLIPINVYDLNYEDPANHSIVYCRIRQYLLHIWNQLPRYFTILACVDRFILITYPARYSTINPPWVMRCIIGSMIIFWHILPIHLLIVVTINNERCGLYGVSYAVHEIYTLVITCLIPPVVMTVFGYLSYRNIKRLHTRIRPIENAIFSNRSNITMHRLDREMLTIVLTEIIVYVVTMFIYPFIVFEVIITNYMGINKSIEYIQIENFIFTIGLLLTYLNCASPFYTYLVASKAFRKDFIELFTKCKRTAMGENIT